MLCVCVAQTIWGIANVVLGSSKLRSVFEERDIAQPRKTTVADLLKKGFRLQADDSWNEEDATYVTHDGVL